MKINNIPISDTFAEAFDLYCTRLIITAADNNWLDIAAAQSTAFATSIIGCDCEAAPETRLTAEPTPDQRPGLALLFFARTPDALQQALANRISQTLLTCPTVAVFDGQVNPDPQQQFALGPGIARFGDGHQQKITQHDRNLWAIPVTEGTALIEDAFSFTHGIAGGNLYICGRSPKFTLAAARNAAASIAQTPNVITPFPGGIARAASKAGSRYKNQIASTNENYCPTLRDAVDSQLPSETNCVYEIVINGTDLSSVQSAMQTAILAACEGQHQLTHITAANFQGRLGKHAIELHKILADVAD